VYINSTQISSDIGGLRALAAAAAAVPLGRGSAGRTEPVNLRVQLAMEKAQSDPEAGEQITRITMGNPLWPAGQGWVKMRQNVNGIEIHYVWNPGTKEVDDYKFDTPTGLPDPWVFPPVSISENGPEF
jgi:filamentous hemagglutinin